MRKFVIMLFFILAPFILVACNGYNNIMYDHLRDIDNYIEVSGAIKEIYYWDDNEKKFWDESMDIISIEDITLYVSLQFNKEDYLKFCGCSGMSDDFDYTTNYIQFEIVPSNVNAIVDNLFFEAISYGDIIKITTSNFIYMDTNFFMIIEIVHNQVNYLLAETGLSNFVSYMKDNRSIF